MSDIIDRLALQVFMTGKIESASLYEDCLTEILRLRAENEKLREALAAERERCANIAENIYYPNEGKMIAAAIRESVE
jgi:hypothetical protein